MNWLLHIFDPATIGVLASQFHDEIQQTAFWIAVGKIIWINVLLSGDNALVIALACRGLQPRHRVWGMILGAGAAVFLRIIFTGIVVTLMELPYLKLVGGLALIVIAAKLLVPEREDEEGVESASHLWAAVQIVVVADIVMSLDNVIAVAAAANGSVPLADPRPRHQHSPDRGGRRADHGAADAASDPGMGRRRLAGLDRGRSHRNRSRRPSEAAGSLRRSGRREARCIAGDSRDGAALWRRRRGGEVLCAVIGVIVVLAAGSIWRRRKLAAAGRRRR